jgi:membrane-associated phospholipid phosphatase
MVVTRRLAPVDRVVVGYVLAVEVLLGVFALNGDAPYWGPLALAHALLAACAFVAPHARHAGAGAVGRFAADWYPVLLLPALYSAIGVVNLHEARSYDALVIRLEELVFGSQVSYRWIREFPQPAFSWVMHACYLAYAAILYSAPLALWISGRRDQARRTIYALACTFFLCYLTFMLFPVAGPRYLFDLAHNAATDVAPARLTQWVLNQGDAWGTAFPSSHVAGALVATGMAYRAWRPLGLVLAPVCAGLVLAVVYGQFHYGVDALSGLMLGGAMLAAFSLREPSPVRVAALRAADPASS